MSTHRTVTVIPGDGIGPECVQAAIEIVDATGVGIHWEERHAGERVFRQGIASGVPRTSRCASCSRPTPISVPFASSLE